ncbi:MAG: LysR substrate-binding domain-containing protein, partial [Pseudomonadota bacterium]
FGTSGSFLKKVSKKISPRFLKVNSVASIMEFVRLGAGVAVIPSHLVQAKSDLFVKKLDQLGRGKIYLSLPNYRMMPKVIQALVDHISD